MRLIGHLDNATHARALGDFLLVQGISSEMESERDGTYAVWIVEEDQLEPARQHLERFRQNPGAPEFQGKEAQANEIRRTEKEAGAKVQQRVKNRRKLFGKLTSYGVGPLTFALIGISIYVGVKTKLGGDIQALQPLVITEWDRFVLGDTGLPEIRAGEVWRLLTPMFIHFGVLHLLFNMLWLFDLGNLIEGRENTGRLAILVLVISASSNFGQYFVSHHPAFGGMSGVVYGLFGYVWMKSKFDRGSGYVLHPQSVTMMLIWFFVCFTGAVGPIANTAHGVGLGVGVAWGWLSSQWSQRKR